MNKVIILQGSFPGGMPHRSVIIKFSCNEYNPTNNIVQRKNATNISISPIQKSSGGNTFQVDSGRLNLNGSGNPIPVNIRQKMESVFNADFSNVRIHTGGYQAESIGALAFTTGNDIYFAQGQYNAHSSHGQRLLGHELTHVVQQRNGRVRNPFGVGVAVVQDPGLEAEAERMGILADSSKILNNNRTSLTNLNNGPLLNHFQKILQGIILNAGDFGERPSQPYRSLEANISDIGIKATLHHVIPWNKLRDFVNKAYERKHSGLVYILSLATLTMLDNSPLILDVRTQGSHDWTSLRTELINVEGYPGDVRTSSAVNAIAAAFAWMPGNLFHGPSTEDRTEDPSEEFETYCYDAIGRTRFLELRAAYDNIIIYLANPSQVVMDRIVRNLENAALQKNPFPYNPNVWERIVVEGTYMYRLKAKPKPIDEGEREKIRLRELLITARLREQREEEERRRIAIEEYNRSKLSSSSDESVLGGINLFGDF